MHLLVVEHERAVAAFIKKGLEEEGFTVDVVHDGQSMMSMAKKTIYNLILLDLQIPQKDGLSVLKDLRDMKITSPILCLTTQDLFDELISVLKIGSEDYLVKPFAFPELVVRVRVLIRRWEVNRGAERRIADLRLDPVSHRTWRGNKEIKLTPREYALLEYFMRYPNQILTRNMLIENAWEENVDPFKKKIEVYINYLRKKIDKDNDISLLHTVRGVGYVLKEPS